MEPWEGERGSISSSRSGYRRVTQEHFSPCIRRLFVSPTLRRHLALLSLLIFPLSPQIISPEKTCSDNLCWG